MFAKLNTFSATFSHSYASCKFYILNNHAKSLRNAKNPGLQMLNYSRICFN